jgi:pimeloyl-ACP methyl ester carboxylesterase
MPTFARDGVDIYYEVKGRGRPLMLVAGLAADNVFWAPSVDALAQRYELILPDNRGAGRTTPLDAPSSIAQMADDCMALAAHLGHARLSLAGHSMGGMVVQHCAARYADRVDRAIVASTSPCPSPRDNDLFATWSKLFTLLERPLWFRNLFYWVLSPAFFAQPRNVDALVQLAAAYAYQQTPQALANQVQAIAGFDTRNDLASIRARTLVMAGTLDLVFPIDAAAAFAKSIPGATFAPVDGAAHSFPIESPREFTQRVLEFLE